MVNLDMSELHVALPPSLFIDHQDSELTLADLKSPATFDAIKHGLKQEKFIALYGLRHQDDLIMCRVAELLISLQSFDEALELLEGNTSLLARALRCKIFYSLKKDEALLQAAMPYLWLSSKEIAGYSANNKEALVHMFEMMALFVARRYQYEFMSLFLKKAARLALELNMQGRYGILKQHSKMANLTIFEDTPSDFDNHNTASSRYEAINKLFKTWKQGEPELSPLLPEYLPAVESWHFIQDKKWMSALTSLKPSSNPSVSILQSLIRFQVGIKLGMAGDISEAIQSLKVALTNLTFNGNIISLAKSVLPLPFLLAAELIPEFSEQKSTIPLLVDEMYRDGLRYNNEVIVLPNQYRKAWLEDDLRPHDFPQMKFISKAVRFRANQKFRDYDLKPFNIVSILSYLEAASYCSSLGYTAFDVLVKKLTTDYPKVKKYLA